jgi:hypothetical protein
MVFITKLQPPEIELQTHETGPTFKIKETVLSPEIRYRLFFEVKKENSKVTKTGYFIYIN